MNKTMNPNEHLEPARAAEIAFFKAIKEGRLSDNPRSNIYAGDFMHMGGNAFKHVMTRAYLT